MKTTKRAGLCSSGTPSDEQMQKINLQSKAPLEASQVYCFSVRLCDDQPDRDFERFDTLALPRLAELMIGKTGICDHAWSAQGQVARIFDAWTEADGDATIVRAWAYMLRNAQTEQIISNIEAGIHREVSIGCSMGETRCSICGSALGSCKHQKGVRYDGKLCCGVLCDPKDAYEFSFVAVPAQSAAGVLKGFSEERALGERYMASLRDESVRLGLSLGLRVERELLQTMAQSLDEPAIKQLNTAMRTLLERKCAGKPQLPTAKSHTIGIGPEFLI